MPATHLRKAAMGTIKAGKISGTKKKQVEEHFITNLVNWQRVRNMRRSKSEIRLEISVC